MVARPSRWADTHPDAPAASLKPRLALPPDRSGAVRKPCLPMAPASGSCGAWTVAADAAAYRCRVSPACRGHPLVLTSSWCKGRSSTRFRHSVYVVQLTPNPRLILTPELETVPPRRSVCRERTRCYSISQHFSSPATMHKQRQNAGLADRAFLPPAPAAASSAAPQGSADHDVHSDASPSGRWEILAQN